MTEPLAHSAPYCGWDQTYRAHVQGTQKLAEDSLAEMKPFVSPASFGRMQARLLASAQLHDLGKLDGQNQRVLFSKQRKGGLPVPHQYAGARYFFRQDDLFSAALIYGHHLPGLPNLLEECEVRSPFCPPRLPPLAKGKLQTYTDEHLAEYLAQHKAFAGELCPPPGQEKISPLEERLLLSCLVDADWSDTGRKSPSQIRPRWQEWIDRLDQYILTVEKAAAADTAQDRERNRLRHIFYGECANLTDFSRRLLYCDASVGSGKTTALFAALLRYAKEKNLRRIFVILPLTTVLSQIEEDLKHALGLEGEEAERTIAVLHHKADYSGRATRELAAAWEAPIVLTTSVGLFETLSSNSPGHLRRLHQLPGSALFLDEFHAAAPAVCLPLIWQWLTELTESWGCHMILASGTPIHFWEDENFKRVYMGKKPAKHPVKEPEPLLSESLQAKLEDKESKRVQRRLSPADLRRCSFSDLPALLDFVLSQPGPRILMMETRQAAAYATKLLQQRGERVLHLSNAFAPQDSEKILRTAEDWLALSRRDPAQRNWTLVATTIAGTGLNLSFCTGFCAAISCISYYQLLGRISRNGEYPEACLWPFILQDPRVKSNHQMDKSREVWLGMIQNGLHDRPLADCSLSEQITFAYREECKRDFQAESLQERFLRMERTYQFAELAEKFHIISDQPTVLAVTDPALIKQLQSGRICSRSQLQRGSVSVYPNVIRQLGLQEFSDFPQLYSLPDSQYDPSFLGYFKNLLP